MTQSATPAKVGSNGALGPLPERWYSVSRVGAATLCVDERDARHTAKMSNAQWPDGAPYRAVMMGDVAAERERCAKVCEQTGAYTDEIEMAHMCAAAIREA